MTLDANSIDFEEQSVLHDNQSYASNHPNVFSAQSKRTTDTAKRSLDHQNILQFDKSCMLCAGQGSLGKQIPNIMKAFKMACLTYQPSPVVFEQKTFDRN